MAKNVMQLSLDDFNSAPVTGVDRPHTLSRYIGGHRRRNHPYVSGYWYLYLDPPHNIFDKPDMNISWFHSSAESFTPPSKTITKVDVPGMGGMASSYIAGQELTREFTVAFREYQNLPITTAIRTWTSVIDTHLGRSPLDGFTPDNYKGNCYAILCKPTVFGKMENLNEQDIEQVYYMEGVFPTTIPDDAFSSDISTNDVAQLSVTFSFDGGFFTKESKDVVTQAVEKMNAVDWSSDSYDDDKNQGTGMKGLDVSDGGSAPGFN